MARRWIVAAALALGLALPAAAAAENTMLVQPDGRVVLAGMTPQAHTQCSGEWRRRSCKEVEVEWPALLRLNVDGSLDGGFGGDGGLVDFRGVQSLPGMGSFTALAEAPGHGLYAASPASSVLRVTRFAGDGGAEPRFGREGLAETTLRPGELAGPVVPTSLLPQADRSLIAGGTLTQSVKGISTGTSFAMRFEAGGAAAEGVGEVSGFPGTIGTPEQSDLLRLEDGSLIAAGSIFGGSGGAAGLLTRMVPGSGVPYDPAFGGAGLVRFPPETPYPGAVGGPVVQDGSRLVAGGASGARILLAGFGLDGKVDPGFGQSGVAGPAIPGSMTANVAALAVQPDGRIVVAGRTFDACDVPSPGVAGCWRLLLARFNADGSLDASFGEGGIARVSPPGNTGFEPGPVDVALLPDGRIVISASPTSRFQAEFTLARFDGQGKPDGSFGGGDGVAYAVPCRGTVSERRRDGCLAAAIPNMGAAGLDTARPRLSLRVRTDNLLDPMVAVRLVLPAALRGRQAAERRIRLATAPRHRATVHLHRGSIAITGMGASRGLSVDTPAGVLSSVRRVAPGHKLVFRVAVKFKDGSSQSFRLKAG